MNMVFSWAHENVPCVQNNTFNDEIFYICVFGFHLAGILAKIKFPCY